MIEMYAINVTVTLTFDLITIMNKLLPSSQTVG